MAATPSFASPDFTPALERQLDLNTTWILAPRPGAVSLSGPLSEVSSPVNFRKANSADFQIDGGTAPAFVFNTDEAYENAAEELANLLYDGDIDFDDITGGQTFPYDHQYGEVELPVKLQQDSVVSAEVLNEYRLALRDMVETMATTADIVFEDEAVVGDQTWGSEGDPKVVLIDVKKIQNATGVSKYNTFKTHYQTIEGNGTLIIKHTMKPDNNLNLNWDGDVYVLGYDGDGSDLFYPRGLNATINGNLVLLASDHTEASFEMKNSSQRKTDITVNGGVLVLAEPTSHEAEVEVENTSTLTINGLLGAYGSRIELESRDSGSKFFVNGALAVGMAQELDGSSYRDDDFEMEFGGKFFVTYDEALANSAVAALGELEFSFEIDGEDAPESYDVQLGGSSSGSTSDDDAMQLLADLVAQQGSGGDFGVVMPEGN